MKWTHRIAAAGGATMLGLALMSTAASAQTPTFDVKKLCEQRIPKLEARATKVLTRINGGPEVMGSVANLRARAERANNPAQADWLNGKAQHRSERAEHVKKAQERLGAYKQKHCGGK